MKKMAHPNIKRIVILLFSVVIVACGSDEDAARIVVGNSNNISSINGDLQYQKDFVVQVTDTDGSPAPNTTINIKLRSLKYMKGYYVVTGSGWVPTSFPYNPPDPIPDSYRIPTPHECNAEDVNNNSVLDVSGEITEDINGNGRLDPTNAATIAAHSTLSPTITAGTNTIITGESGFGYFSLVYPKSEGVWSEVEITVSAKVSGTENAAVFNETLPVALADVSDVSISPPGGTNSPYGRVADCQSQF